MSKLAKLSGTAIVIAAVTGLSACSSMHHKPSPHGSLEQIIKQEGASGALLFNKEGKLVLVDVASGTKVATCSERGGYKEGRPECKPLDNARILKREAINITVWEGSLCASFEDGGDRTDYCSPDFPPELIHAIRGD